MPRFFRCGSQVAELTVADCRVRSMSVVALIWTVPGSVQRDDTAAKCV